MLFGRDFILGRRIARESPGRRRRSPANLTENDVGQGDVAEEQADLAAKFGPQVVGLTSFGELPRKSVARTGLVRAAGGANWLIDGGDDGGDGNTVGVARQAIAAAGSAGRGDQAGASQPGEELLQVRLAQLLAGGDFGEADRAAFATERLAGGQIDQRHDRVAAACGQLHAYSAAGSRDWDWDWDWDCGWDWPNSPCEACRRATRASTSVSSARRPSRSRSSGSRLSSQGMP